MTELVPVLLAAFWLGAAHALEVDHMIAVSVFVGGSPRLRAAAGFGIRWGLGHAAAVLAIGGLMAWSGLRMPDVALGWAERGIGAMLVGLGLWAVRAAGRVHLHVPAAHGGHGHLHAHSGAASHTHHHSRADVRHGHVSTLVGAAHGLAGTAPAVALIPVTFLPSFPVALVYLTAFGVGTMLAMGTYAVLAALAIRRASASLTVARGIARVTALASIGVGVWWIVGAAPS